MQIVKQVLLSTAVFILAALMLNWALGEALVLYEMYGTGATSRSELSEDYGMGMIGVLIVGPLSIFGACVAAATMWVLVSRHNKALHPTRRTTPRG